MKFANRRAELEAVLRQYAETGQETELGWEPTEKELRAATRKINRERIAARKVFNRDEITSADGSALYYRGGWNRIMFPSSPNSDGGERTQP